MAEGILIRPVRGIGDVTEGLDLAAEITSRAPWLATGDILVVTSKIVSKAEGRLVYVPAEGPDRDTAREAVLAAETARPVARRGQTHIVQTRHGFVLAAAGIDASNVDRSRLVLLPVDPDGSARALRDAVRRLAGVDVAVVITDTMGRPWRLGLIDVAIGAAGIEPLRDHRGETDPYGNELSLTQMAVVDELASAAELVKGKCDGIPVAVVTGLPAGSAEGRAPHGPGAAALVRPADQDMFSLGTAEARAAGLRDAAALGDVELGPATVDPAVAHRAVAAFAAALPPGIGLSVGGAGLRQAVPAPLPDDCPLIGCRLTDPGDPALHFGLGTFVQRLRAALAADGYATMWLPLTPAGPDHPVGVLAVGHAK